MVEPVLGYGGGGGGGVRTPPFQPIMNKLMLIDLTTSGYHGDKAVSNDSHVFLKTSEANR